ncbi:MULTISPECIES: metallophosphoesterase family protein [Bacillus]|uniref:Metallophosphoesterase n=2 Tax=Bacillus TaxID=1386 RepID=A0A0M4FTV5_9BACI|nr:MULTISPECIES: metallophosphoesterase [Bacillus]ALC83535.1 metallophosphoesterase [Bacillus gobiensis]MBP1082517.1 3',5'-cyclic AMP phosphodiesterase CpdA [Bacillus capparidis]MED1097249.1 metallophosphoesterase [Bacillus capparidis]
MKVVLMGDLHYPEIEDSVSDVLNARAAFYQMFIDRFLEIDADLHVSIGDLTNFGHATELQEIYKLLRRKERNFYHALGNHDLYAQTREEVLTITGQPRYHSIVTDEAVFAFLDTAKEMDFEDWGGHIDDEQLQWFENVVKDSGSKPLLVFAHHPIYNTTKNSDKEKGSIHPSIDMWRILDQKEGVGVYLNGHTHCDSIVNQKNWTFVQTSAVLDQHAFRLIEIEKDEIVISSLDITDQDIIDNAPIIYNHINHFTHSPAARGEEADRECRISLLPVVDHTS